MDNLCPEYKHAPCVGAVAVAGGTLGIKNTILNGQTPHPGPNLAALVPRLPVKHQPGRQRGSQRHHLAAVACYGSRRCARREDRHARPESDSNSSRFAGEGRRRAERPVPVLHVVFPEPCSIIAAADPADATGAENTGNLKWSGR